MTTDHRQSWSHTNVLPIDTVDPMTDTICCTYCEQAENTESHSLEASGTRILPFYGSIAKRSLTKTVQFIMIFTKYWGDINIFVPYLKFSGGPSPAPPPTSPPVQRSLNTRYEKNANAKQNTISCNYYQKYGHTGLK